MNDKKITFKDFKEYTEYIFDDNKELPFDENYIFDNYMADDDIDEYLNSNTFNYFKDKIYYKEFASNDDLFTIFENTWIDNVGSYFCNSMINKCDNLHLFMENTYIERNDSLINDFIFESNIEYIKEKSKTNEWIHTDLYKFCKGNPIITRETNNTYVMVRYNKDIKLSSIARCSKKYFKNSEDFDDKLIAYIKSIDKEYKIEKLPNPAGYVHY